MVTEYLYTTRDGWQPCATPRLTDTTPSAATPLLALGYELIGESAMADCGIGQFFVLQRRVPDPAWPRYALHLTQWRDESVIWISDLPSLWEWIRLYGPVARMLHWTPDDDDEDDEDEDEEADTGPRCPDCGQPMTLHPAIPLEVWLGKEATEFDVD